MDSHRYSGANLSLVFSIFPLRSKRTLKVVPYPDTTQTGSYQGVLDEFTVVFATSSEGTGTKPGVPDEEKVSTKEKIILEWGSEQESEYSEEELSEEEEIDWIDSEEDDEKKDDTDDDKRHLSSRHGLTLKKFKKDAPCQAFKNQERHRLKGESSPSQRLKGESSPSPLLVSTRRNQQHLGRAFT
ncbi:hypothetical protein Tco_0989717 [Tanacetum coccineum]|uniref:Uncharacterized protein n=1 Tax=Tanacetum coccineum TaxID=301880 RepID=A0ABQ5EV66_9ASTR